MNGNNSKNWLALLSGTLMLAGCHSAPPPTLVYTNNVAGGAVLVGSKYSSGPLGAFSACASEIDGQPVANSSNCDFIGAQRLTLAEGSHKLRIGLWVDDSQQRTFVGGAITVPLKAGETYAVQGEVISTDKIRILLTDSKGARVGSAEGYLTGAREARFLKDSGQKNAPEKHQIFLAADFGPRADKIEGDFLTAFAALAASCDVKATTLSLPRPAAQLTLDAVQPLSEAEIRRRAGSADGLIEVRMVTWSSPGGIGGDATSPLQYGTFTLSAKLMAPSTGAVQWDASLDLKVSNMTGGTALADALVQRFAELGIFKACPASAIR